MTKTKSALAALVAVACPALALAQTADTGSTAWLLTATALVLMMTLPGLALFYGGLVRSRNVLSVLMQCFALCCIVSVIWVAFGYSVAFADGNGFIGGLSKAWLRGVHVDTVSGAVPETVFSMFQLTFAIITPALIVGAYVERIKFAAVLLFSTLWLIVVYFPVAHWVWGPGGWLFEMGVRDFAGGLVVHTTAGISAVVLAMLLRNRTGFPHEIKPPHQPGLVVMGAAMLWVGWFGFNAGSALTAGQGAGMAMTVTHLAAATATLVWMAIEWVRYGKPSVIGAVTGTIAGLATITPASGFVGPFGALILGVAASFVCYFATHWVKRSLRIDDSLDVFAVHGVGGMLGVVLTSFLADPLFQGQGLAEGKTILSHFGVQVTGVVSIAVFSLIATVVLAKITDAVVGLRVSKEEEFEGLDITGHGERAYDI